MGISLTGWACAIKTKESTFPEFGSNLNKNDALVEIPTTQLPSRPLPMDNLCPKGGFTFLLLSSRRSLLQNLKISSKVNPKPASLSFMSITLGEGVNKVQILGNRIVSAVDFSSLEVITADILRDDENIYIGNHNGISVIPIKALGLNVKIFTE